MKRLTKSERIMAGIWKAVRSMIEPELERYRARYPQSRRRQILEALHAAALQEDDAALVQAGQEYFKLTSIIPPGCYAWCHTRERTLYFHSERITGRRRGEEWILCRFSPQVYR